jgi:hypothetical protein
MAQAACSSRAGDAGGELRVPSNRYWLLIVVRDWGDADVGHPATLLPGQSGALFDGHSG